MDRRTFVKTAACTALAAGVGSLPASFALAQQNAEASYDQVLAHIDTAFSESIADAISALGDNPDVGNRSAGSPAEAQVIDFMASKMEEIGLTNVTKDTFTCDNWTFEKARLYLPGNAGTDDFIALGGFATSIDADMEELAIVDGGQGTIEDLEGLDMAGKLVLISIDQYADWWINHPAYQAHLLGARAVIACNTSGFCQYDGDTVGSQDACGPHEAAALSISVNGYKAVLEAIAQGGGEALVTLDAKSVITLGGQSANVWGDIPGESDELILVGAHMDGYYHSFFDDAFGCSVALSMAKAVIESGYKPAKTLRFVFHGAEEWGKTNCESDWAVGSWKMITELHPEWAEQAFMMLNIDDMFNPAGEVNYWLTCPYELFDYTCGVLDSVFAGYPQFNVVVDAPSDTGTDQFCYSQCGVAVIDAAMGEPDECYYKRNLYHTNMDNKCVGTDPEAYQMVHEVFTKLLVSVDALTVRPMFFAPEFEALEEGFAPEVVSNPEEFLESLASAQEAARTLDELTESAQVSDAPAYNKALFGIYRDIRAGLYAWDWNGSVAFPYEQAQGNIAALDEAIAALEAGEGDRAYDDIIYQVDYNWYAYSFSQECFEAQLVRVRDNAEGTWGEGLIKRPCENLYDVIAFLGEHYGEEGVDYSEAIARLSEARTNQQMNLDDIVAETTRCLAALAESMGEVATVNA